MSMRPMSLPGKIVCKICPLWLECWKIFFAIWKLDLEFRRISPWSRIKVTKTLIDRSLVRAQQQELQQALDAARTEADRTVSINSIIVSVGHGDMDGSTYSKWQPPDASNALPQCSVVWSLFEKTVIVCVCALSETWRHTIWVKE